MFIGVEDQIITDMVTFVVGYLTVQTFICLNAKVQFCYIYKLSSKRAKLEKISGALIQGFTHKIKPSTSILTFNMGFKT